MRNRRTAGPSSFNVRPQRPVLNLRPGNRAVAGTAVRHRRPGPRVPARTHHHPLPPLTSHGRPRCRGPSRHRGGTRAAGRRPPGRVGPTRSLYAILPRSRTSGWGAAGPARPTPRRGGRISGAGSRPRRGTSRPTAPPDPGAHPTAPRTPPSRTPRTPRTPGTPGVRGGRRASTAGTGRPLLPFSFPWPTYGGEGDHLGGREGRVRTGGRRGSGGTRCGGRARDGGEAGHAPQRIRATRRRRPRRVLVACCGRSGDPRHHHPWGFQ